MLPIWGRGCVLPHWPVTGEGAGRGGGAAPPAECSRRPGLAPHLLLGRCTCSCSLPSWEKSVEGDARLGWLPCSPWKRQWVMQVCFWPLRREGPKRLRSFSAAKLPLGRVGEWWGGQAEGGGARRETALWQCLCAHVLPSRVQPTVAGARAHSALTPGRLGSLASRLRRTHLPTRPKPDQSVRRKAHNPGLGARCRRPGSPGYRKSSGNAG